MATMTGNESLNNDSVIKISVFAENGSVKEYNIYIDKVSATNNNLLYVGIAVFIIGLVAFIGSIYYFKRK